MKKLLRKLFRVQPEHYAFENCTDMLLCLVSAPEVWIVNYFLSWKLGGGENLLKKKYLCKIGFPDKICYENGNLHENMCDCTLPPKISGPLFWPGAISKCVELRS